MITPRSASLFHATVMKLLQGVIGILFGAMQDCFRRD
jgi:hypothetical protein